MCPGNCMFRSTGQIGAPSEGQNRLRSYTRVSRQSRGSDCGRRSDAPSPATPGRWSSPSLPSWASAARRPDRQGEDDQIGEREARQIEHQEHEIALPGAPPGAAQPPPIGKGMLYDWLIRTPSSLLLQGLQAVGSLLDDGDGRTRLGHRQRLPAEFRGAGLPMRRLRSGLSWSAWCQSSNGSRRTMRSSG